ncbi:MAG: transposase, partial [SAR324 cluster bacterium]|nr:transposase [SAR324 cluster bacterium]
RRTGVYPESLHVDKIYRTRENRQYCNSKDIRMSGPPLGRPSKEDSVKREQFRNDEIDRIPIEGKFGQAKRRYSLKLIMTKLKETSQCAIALVFLVMNLQKRATSFYFLFFLRGVRLFLIQLPTIDRQPFKSKEFFVY